MGRKHKRHEAHNIEEEEQKGYEFLHGKPLIPEWWHKADKHQVQYASSIDYARVTMVDAKAGTGKTTIAIKKGLEYLQQGRIDKIAYIRFVDARSMKLGAMPGNEAEKTKGFLRPFFDALHECGLSQEDIGQLMELEVLEAGTDIFWRGGNMKRVFLIIDECQNGSIDDIQLILTRLHDAGKGIAIGHSGQVDRKLPRYGRQQLIPFQVYQLHMAKKPWTKCIQLYKNYRGEVSQWADDVYLTLNEITSEADK